VPKAEAIIDGHVEKFLSWQASVELVGMVEALRKRLRQERASFVRSQSDSIRRFNEADRAHVEALMDQLLERLLLEPAQRLRAERQLRRKIQNIEALRDVFLGDKEKP
jgi:glutamyl-tRNA reductase